MMPSSLNNFLTGFTIAACDSPWGLVVGDEHGVQLEFHWVPKFLVLGHTNFELLPVVC
jgi:hypothetical protein